MALNGLYSIHLELTSKCNKQCWMCGRRKAEKENPKLLKSYGNMDFSLVKKLSEQIPDGTVVQFHNNGEPLLYPKFKEALKLFKGKIRHFDTNGKLLLKRVNDIIGNCEALTLSTFPEDEEFEEQYETLKRFLFIKGDEFPRVMIRFTGHKAPKKWVDLGCTIIDRVLHDPMGSFLYEKPVVIPEIGICQEILNHLAIDRFGNVYPCVRFDPEKKGILGNINDNTLDEIWNGKQRKKWIEYHIAGRRETIPFCNKCEYWGIPRSL